MSKTLLNYHNLARRSVLMPNISFTVPPWQTHEFNIRLNSINIRYYQANEGLMNSASCSFHWQLLHVQKPDWTLQREELALPENTRACKTREHHACWCGLQNG
jgi:hypothetical protein